MPNKPFKTIMVKNIPFNWNPLDLFNCFSTCGSVVGSFIYYSLDNFGNKYGLVEMATHADAFHLCVKGVFHAGSTVFSLLPTDVKGLADWLGVPEEMKQGPWIPERNLHLGNKIAHCEKSYC